MNRAAAIRQLTLAMTLVSVVGTAQATSREAPRGMRRIQGGSYQPFYQSTIAPRVTVRAFALDAHPVTNADFLAFVRAHPAWQRSQVPRVFAEEGYLSQWHDDLDLGSDASPDQPVTRISWFAARAFCAARHARLPTESEWEWAARASESSPDASRDPVFIARVLEWYARPQGTALGRVGQRAPNLYGLYDLHGLVWEWVFDFNAARGAEDSRALAGRSCGSAQTDATNVSDYAAFMRFAFRSSLRASFTVRNLGFRCAADLE